MFAALSRLLTCTKLALLVQYRSYFPQIYLLLAALTALALRLPDLRGHAEFWLPVLLLVEPAGLGLYMTAAQQFLDRNERNLAALVVSPLRSGEYILGQALATSIVATGAGALIFVVTLGFRFSLVPLVPLLFVTATLAGIAGLLLSAYFKDFTSFLVGSAVPILLLALPVLGYFDLVSPAWFRWVPSHTALFGFARLTGEWVPLSYALDLGELLALTGLAFWLAHRSFRERVWERLGEAWQGRSS